MGLLDRLRALLRRPRRDVPVGRHSRVLPGPSVPGAAASLVSSTGTAGVVQADAEPDPPVDPSVRMVQADAAASPPPSAAPRTAAPADPAPAEPAAGPPEPAPAAAVMLGFADGGTLALDPDDPRVRTFKAAAEALLEEPRA